MISFEFPANERARTLLRLEQLYQRLEFHLAGDDPYAHHAALQVMFELLESAARADIKTDLLQELERQKQQLDGWRDNPDVNQDSLEELIEHIECAAQRLHEVTGKFGAHLRDNEWLMTIRQRMVIPGGTCQFDLPAYHVWLRRSAEARRADLQGWIAPLLPTADAAAILLQLLRDSAKGHDYLAHKGSFQQMSGGRVVQLVRVDYDEALNVVPELSVNKYALNVRFVNAVPGVGGKMRQTELDVPFRLSFCKL